MISKHLSLFALAVFALFLLLVPFTLQEYLFAFIYWLEGYAQTAPIVGAALFFLASAASVLVAFLSSVVLVPTAILVWGEFPAFLLLYAGWIMGGISTYGIGRLLGKRVVRRLVDPEKFSRVRSYASERMPFATVAILVVSVPAEIPGYALGILRYPFRKFLLALSLAELPFAVVSVYASGELLQGRYAGFSISIALLTILAWIASKMFESRKRDSR